MIVRKCTGHELVKAKPTSPEEFFNQSEVTYESEGREKELKVLYLRYFEDRFEEFVPYRSQPLFMAGERGVHLKDIVALICLLYNPDNQKRKRIYISDEEEFDRYCRQADFSMIEKMVVKIEIGDLAIG
ncbi:MAG: hypothetical protein ACI4XL_07070 [Bacillus sp. (in: firmicutes)]